MSHVVLIGGPQLRSLVDVLAREVLVGGDWSVFVLLAADVASFNYKASSDPLPQLVDRLESGELASVQMSCKEPPQLLVGIYPPMFCNEPPNQWRCIVEGPPDDAARLYAAILGDIGIAYVAHSVDEAPDLSSAQVSAESFPWDDWRLIRAAVLSKDGRWDEREGRASRP